VTAELSVERHLIRRVKDRGGWAIKLIPWAVAGLPDRMVLLPNKRLYFVELKAKGGRLRPAQHMVRRKLGLLGWEVYVLNSREQIDDWFVYIEESDQC
jgi:hypothetical protein